MSSLRQWLALPLAGVLLLGSSLAASQVQAASAAESSKSLVSSLSSKQQVPVLKLADPKATAATRSLFLYLQLARGKEILFGQQHATDEALSAPVNGVKSDTYSAVGDEPAVFGWDTLSLEGYEKPGSTSNTTKQNRDNLIYSMRQAYEKGGVLTLSAHMPNFVSGKDFYDTSGNVVSHILPGGDKHAKYNQFLDRIADFALHLKDRKGDSIPVIFRPFHEQNGGWFWWGAPYATKEQYIEIYRYTVEYLRDVKGVHNFLYAFSPGSPFNGLEESYLRTYPGDDYADVLGFDTYYDGKTQGWFDTAVEDGKLVSRIADKRDKVAAFTEFGYQNVKPAGTEDKQFYTKLLTALQSDPDAKRLAYMLTWANFSYDNIYVPYRNSAEHGDHELLPDFVNYYKDSYTSFSRELRHVYDQKTSAAQQGPSMHIVSPTGQETMTSGTTTIRARVLNEKPAKVVYTTGGSDKEYPLKLDKDGYYSAEWQPAASLNGKSTTLTVLVYGKDKKGQKQSIQKQSIIVYFGMKDSLVKRLTFDKDILNASNNGTYPDTISSSFRHEKVKGDGKLAVNVKGMQTNETWQELKIGLKDIAKQVNLKLVNRVSMEVLIPIAAGNGNPEANLRAAAELPPSSSKFQTTAAAKLNELPTVKIGNTVYARYTPVIDLNDPSLAASAEGLQLALIGSGLKLDGTLYIDNVKLMNSYSDGSSNPLLVDNYELYKGSSDLLRTSYSVNGDTNTFALDPMNKEDGEFGLKFDYTLAGQGYTGITKDLGSRDWSKAGRLRLWLKPDGSGKKLVIQVKANGVSFEYYPSLAGTEPGVVEMPFSDFKVAAWDTQNAGKTLDVGHAAKVQAFSIYVNAQDGDAYSKDNPYKGTLYVDQIEAVVKP
ncbi:glycosyl hydrolase [Paenibacillus sp. JX-17]|uniref:Glycosyl hydrolase n=1 Tax=Paenibacillus lacisoli TaxID=3064525 RepID=A0ABT9C902_9BACL|nr:glycosyl hydrolase [Paenibacillus sp. JX-17]MDO7905729.1 glycosyl hydrolase [Paenibacillus sp. JX-17]